MLELRGITKTYNQNGHKIQVLKGINLTIQTGEFIAILGPSGSGKSTLLQILGLLDRFTSGSFLVFGHETAALTDDETSFLRKKAFGFIFQQFHLLARTSSAENVALPLLYSEGSFDLKRARDLLEMVDLANRVDHTPSELSGGQQQRVAIARALINHPKIILADEPTGNLDPKSKLEVLAILKSLNDKGLTVVLVTHEEEMTKHADRVIRLRDGNIESDIIQRTPELARSPGTLELRPKPLPLFKQIWIYFVQGLRSLANNKMRTLLSILGIFIGVTAVIAMLAIGKGAQDDIEEKFRNFGSNQVDIYPGEVRGNRGKAGAGSYIRIFPADAREMRDAFPDASDVYPFTWSKASVVYQSNNRDCNFLATTPNYKTVNSLSIVSGRFFTDEENSSRARVVVIGMTIVRELFNGENPVGKELKITAGKDSSVGRVNYRVIGVLAEKGAGPGGDQDDLVIVPMNTGLYRVIGRPDVQGLSIAFKNLTNYAATKEEILTYLTARFHVPYSQREKGFYIFNRAEFRERLKETSRTFGILVASIAAISLLVGGIGIMNVMLVSVAERTKEIGLRKAIGATSFDILVQFLVESIVITVLGGVLGVVMGTALSITMSQVFDWRSDVTFNSILLGFCSSLFIGLIFGIFPARKASQLSPIEALRYE